MTTTETNMNEFRNQTTPRQNLPNQTLEMINVFPEHDYVHEERREGKEKIFHQIKKRYCLILSFITLI